VIPIQRTRAGSKIIRVIVVRELLAAYISLSHLMGSVSSWKKMKNKSSFFSETKKNAYKKALINEWTMFQDLRDGAYKTTKQ
jgi:hypothetical protein